MENIQKDYLSKVRENTAYPKIRTAIALAKFVGYLSITIGGFLWFFSCLTVIAQSWGFVAGIFFGFLMSCISIWLSVLLLNFITDLFLMLVDFCDSTIQKNADGFQNKPTGGKVSKAAMEEAGLPFVKKNAVGDDSFKSV